MVFVKVVSTQVKLKVILMHVFFFSFFFGGGGQERGRIKQDATCAM